MQGEYIFAGIVGVYVIGVLIYMSPWMKKYRPDEPWHREKHDEEDCHEQATHQSGASETGRG